MRRLQPFCAALCFALFGYCCLAQTETNVSGPRITFSAPVFDFGKVMAGKMVKHTFAFTNTGTQVLEVTNVEVSCGCTATSEWSRRVEPGQGGTVEVQFSTAGFGGDVLKGVTVHSTDKLHPAVALQLKGNVWKAIDVLPSFAVLNIMPDATSASVSITLTNNTDEYVVITSGPKCSTNAFTAQIRTNQPGKSFQVTVEAVPPFKPGNIQGMFTLTTTSTNVPIVSVGIWAIIQPKLAIIPNQITLPPGPLAARTVQAITIQNNSTNLVKVSAPACSVPNTQVDFKELMAGRVYSVTVAFPSGFEVSAGEQPALTFETSLPDLPIARIPISHLPKPAQTPAAGAPVTSR